MQKLSSNSIDNPYVSSRAHAVTCGGKRSGRFDLKKTPRHSLVKYRQILCHFQILFGNALLLPPSCRGMNMIGSWNVRSPSGSQPMRNLSPSLLTNVAVILTVTPLNMILSSKLFSNTEKMRDCHLVARTCDNEVGVAISIRDPYTSPFTSRCKFARCLLLVRCLSSETVAIGFLSSVEPNFVERTALGSLKRRRSYSR